MATDKKLTGIRFPEELMDKIKYIAWHERRTITNTVLIGMEDFVEDWEAQNEPITKQKIREKVYKDRPDTQLDPDLAKKKPTRKRS